MDNQTGKPAPEGATQPELQAQERTALAAEEAELNRLQAWLISRIQTPFRLQKSPEITGEAEAQLTGSWALSPVAQLEIYREQYWLRHTHSLLEDYPCISRLLSQASWERLVEGYLIAHPPAHPSLRELGASLPAFIRALGEPEPAQFYFELARLEWAYIELFDAPDAATISPEEIMGVAEADWPGAILHFKPELQLLENSYPLRELYQQLRGVEQEANGSRMSPEGADRASRGAQNLLPAPSPEFLVLYRRELDSFAEPLSPAAFRFLSLLRGGAPLLQATEQLISELPALEEELEHLAQGWFSRWASLGWLTRIEVSKPSSAAAKE